MAGITLAQAQAQLDAWLAASLAVSRKQSYTIGGRQMTLADVQHITAQVTFWEARVSRLTRGGLRVRGVTPR